MCEQGKANTLIVSLLMLVAPMMVGAGSVEILAADFRHGSGENWSLAVTLKHGDTGWDHFADNWRVVDGEGNVLGDRVLHHPHVNEQPFTRNLSSVTIPPEIDTVYIEAHDSEHGWTSYRLKVDLNRAVDGRLRVEADK